jgi:hypothetical protein
VVGGEGGLLKEGEDKEGPVSLGREDEGVFMNGLGGRAIFGHYNRSLTKMVMTIYPEKNWLPWKFNVRTSSSFLLLPSLTLFPSFPHSLSLLLLNHFR